MGLHPTPINETRATSLSEVTPWHRARRRWPERSPPRCQVGLGDGERDVGRPLADAFCTIMSMLIDWLAWARKSFAATRGDPAGRSLSPWLRSCRGHRGDNGLFHVCILLDDQVPGSQVKLERTCSGTL